MVDIVNLNSFQNRINELTAKGKNLADYEIQHTSTGFRLRSSSSLFTKISKFLHPEQYNVAQNITILAEAARTHVEKGNTHINLGSIHKALTQILQKQIKDTSTSHHHLNVTNAVLSKLGMVFVQKKNAAEMDQIEPLQAFLTTMKREIDSPPQSLPHTLRELIPALKQDLESYQGLQLNPATQKVLEKEFKNLFETIHSTLLEKSSFPVTDFSLLECDEMFHLLASLRPLVDSLTPHVGDVPDTLTMCLQFLDNLKTANKPENMLRFIVNKCESEGVNPIELFREPVNPLQKGLEELQRRSPDEYETLVTNPEFIQQKDRLLTLILQTPLKPMNITSVRPSATPAPSPHFQPEGEDPVMHALVTKWLSKFPNANVIRQTLGREDLGSIVINTQKMPEERVAALKALKTKNTEFEAYAKVALIAEELATQMQKASPEKSPAEVETEVARLMSMTPKESNPFGDLPIALQTFVNTMGGFSEVPLALSSSLLDPSKQAEDRFTFEVTGDSSKLTVKGVYTLNDGETTRLLNATAQVVKAHDSDVFQGVVHLEPQAGT